MTRSLTITISVLAALLAVTAVASAAVYGPGIPTRQQYVAKAERVCTKMDAKMFALTKAASKAAKAGDAKTATHKFGQVPGVFAKGVGQLKKLPKPTADKGRLTRWLRSMDKDVDLLKAEAKAYKAIDAEALAKSVKAASKHGKKTNAIVNGFGFNTCLIAV